MDTISIDANFDLTQRCVDGIVYWEKIREATVPIPAAATGLMTTATPLRRRVSFEYAFMDGQEIVRHDSMLLTRHGYERFISYCDEHFSRVQ
ncbi:MAG: hypothetical protein KJ601_08095 [Nanoarchaeota archaeon]|nr:hypothetical protein [Nanoarchaeota archaeon]